MRNRSKNRVLVCGSEGSLMSAIIPKLAGENYDVLGVDTCERYGHRGRAYKPGLDDEWQDYQFVQMDLCDAQATRTLINTFQPNYIIQGAAKIYGVGGFNKYAADILGDDIALHRNVLNAAVECGTVEKVDFISSSMVYERCEGKVPVHEADPHLYGIPHTDYGLSKMTNERLSEAYERQYGLNTTIWRPFNIITPYETADGQMGDSHVFADFIKSLVLENKEDLDIIGDGEQVRCFTWYKDVADIIARNIANKDSHGYTFNIGSTEPVTMKTLALTIRQTAYAMKLVNSQTVNFIHHEAPFGDVKYRVPNVNLAKDLLGWKPTKDFNQCVEECLKVAMCKLHIKKTQAEWKERDKAYVKQMEYGT